MLRLVKVFELFTNIWVSVLTRYFEITFDTATSDEYHDYEVVELI